MIAEVLADAGRVVDYGDAHFAQVLRRADTGKHQQLRGRHGAAAHDDQISLDGEDLAAALGLNSHRSR